MINSKSPSIIMKKYAFIFLLPLIVISVAACGEETDVVESGTYAGTIDEVVAEEKEIYVETEDNKRLELYFTETTELTQNGQIVPFDSLQQGQQVRVKIEKVGKRLDPISVQILQ